MPIITDKREINSLKETHKHCYKCEDGGGRNERSSIIICDICSNWICKECSGVDSKLLDLVVKNDLNYNYICIDCKNQLPQLKDLMQIAQKQMRMENEIVAMKADIEENKKSIKDYEDVKERLSKVEKILENNKLDNEEFPPLPAMNAATEQIRNQITSQQENTTWIKSNLEEEKRKEAIKMNLIIYGIPENENDIESQMKADFNTLQELYSDRVQLDVGDLSNITRLGRKSDKIRPLRITFVEMQKRKEILTNNKGLIMEDEEFKMCNCVKNPGKHIHINVTNDKTKLERELENTLREELKMRRSNGEDVTIRKGKIVNRNVQKTQARWDLVRQNV